jgi:hypothetical protein
MRISMNYGEEFRDLIECLLGDLNVEWESLTEDQRVKHLNRANDFFSNVWNAGYREGLADGRYEPWP